MFLETLVREFGRVSGEDRLATSAAFRARCEAVSRQAIGRVAAWANDVF
jgi:hypothetical protein